MIKTILAVAVFGLTTATAHAQQCGPADKLFVEMLTKYGERLDGVGLTATASFQTWANRDTGTWTIVRVTPAGVACVIASGDDWTVDRTPPGVRM